MIDGLKVNFSIENMDEFKELLQKAHDQSEQLNKTLFEIQNFEFQINTDKKSKS